jgi:hypothetical protein
MKTIFVMNVENCIDLITNSSSELFVLKGGTKEAVIQMLDNIDPAWRDEYEEPKNILDLSIDELNTYFSYACSPCCWPASRHNYPILDGFTFYELYEPESDKRAWNGEIQYELRNNKVDSVNRWERDFITEDNRMVMIDKHNPKHNMWFMFSFGENPNWELQEKLEYVANRYHLG